MMIMNWLRELKRRTRRLIHSSQEPAALSRRRIPPYWSAGKLVGLASEVLEDRTLLAVSIHTSGALSNWTPIGPTSTTNGQVERIPSIETRVRNDHVTFEDLVAGNVDNGDFNIDYTLENPVIGAIHTVAAHPVNRDTLYIGAVNGGIWTTENATAFTPHWEPLTDHLPSLSIGALEFDATDPSGDTLIAGVGRFSSFNSNGGVLTGLLRTTDGASWQTVGTAAADLVDNDQNGITDDEVGLPALWGLNISAVAARGSTLLAAANGGVSPGLYYSTDGGLTWTRPSSGQDLSVPVDGTIDALSGSVIDVVSDPGDPNAFYAALLPSYTGPTLTTRGGIFRITLGSTGGLNVTDISGNALAPLNIVINQQAAFVNNTWGGTNNIEMAVHNNVVTGTNAVYAAVMYNGQAAGFSAHRIKGERGPSWTFHRRWKTASVQSQSKLVLYREFSISSETRLARL